MERLWNQTVQTNNVEDPAFQGDIRLTFGETKQIILDLNETQINNAADFTLNVANLLCNLNGITRHGKIVGNSLLRLMQHFIKQEAATIVSPLPREPSNNNRHPLDEKRNSHSTTSSSLNDLKNISEYKISNRNLFQNQSLIRPLVHESGHTGYIEFKVQTHNPWELKIFVEHLQGNRLDGKTTQYGIVGGRSETTGISTEAMRTLTNYVQYLGDYPSFILSFIKGNEQLLHVMKRKYHFLGSGFRGGREGDEIHTFRIPIKPQTSFSSSPFLFPKKIHLLQSENMGHSNLELLLKSIPIRDGSKLGNLDFIETQIKSERVRIEQRHREGEDEKKKQNTTTRFTNQILSQPHSFSSPPSYTPASAIPQSGPTYLQSRLPDPPRIQNTIHTPVIQQVTGSWTASPDIIQRNHAGGFTITFPDTKEQVHVPASQVPQHIQNVAAPPPPPPPPVRRFCGKLHHVCTGDPLLGQISDDRCPECSKYPSSFNFGCQRSF